MTPAGIDRWRHEYTTTGYFRGFERNAIGRAGQEKTRQFPGGVSTNQLVFTVYRGINGDVFPQRYLYTATCDKDPGVGIQA